jgi:nitronate monooxygenase
MLLDTLPIPIVQGPMLGASGPDLAIAVSKAGGLGSLAAAGMSPDVMRQNAEKLRQSVPGRFLINLFILPDTVPDPAQIKAAMARLAPWRDAYGLPEQALPNQWAEAFAPQFAALVEIEPPAASFTFGILTREQIDALKARDTFVIGTATTAAEAKAWAEVGADAICAQGLEAGGHRGTFLRDVTESQIGTLSLVSTIREAVDRPVVAAGGITDGNALAAALAMGAAAAQIGTAYLPSDESLISQPWRRAIAEVDDDATRLTRAFSGRHARGIENRFMREMRPFEHEIPAYPVQNALTQELRAAVAKADSSEALSLWAGQSVKLAKAGSAAEITERLWRDAQETLRQTTQRWT